MIPRLPRTLVVGLACIATVFFGIGMYLEANELDFLQRHPITVNLLSSVVGFSTGLLTVALGVSWFVRRERLLARYGRLNDVWREYTIGAEQVIVASRAVGRGNHSVIGDDVGEYFRRVLRNSTRKDFNGQALRNAAMEWITRCVDTLVMEFGLDDTQRVPNAVRGAKTTIAMGSNLLAYDEDVLKALSQLANAIDSHMIVRQFRRLRTADVKTFQRDWWGHADAAYWAGRRWRKHQDG